MTGDFTMHHQLLHLEDGCLHLNTGEFRPTSPSDLNTFTTGFNYQDYQDSQIDA